MEFTNIYTEQYGLIFSYILYIFINILIIFFSQIILIIVH